MDSLADSSGPQVAESQVKASSPAQSDNGGEGADRNGLDLIELTHVLQRRRNVIFGCIALFTTICAAIVFQITPRYTAEAAVMLGERKTEVVNVQAVLSGLSNDAAVIRSEVEVLKSLPIAEQVVKKLNLTANSEFNPALRTASVFAPFREAATWLVSLGRSVVGLRPAASDMNPEEVTFLTTARMLQSRMEVINDGRDYVLRVQAQSEDPKLAAAIANATTDAYLNAQLEAKFEAVRRANAWLNDHLAALKSEVEASDRAVQQFKADHNLITTSANTGQTVAVQQLSELNTQLILASADRAQKEANLRQVQDQLRSGGVDAVAQVLASPLIEALRQQEATLLTQDAQLATKYKPEHPAMINIKAQEKDLQAKIKVEIDKIVASMAGEVQVARAKEDSLRSSLQALQQTSSAQNEATVQLHELERQADSNRTLYENFLNRFKQTSEQEGIQEPDARLMAAASIPTQPSYPRSGLLITLAFVSSILIGIAIAFGIEHLDNGFRTGDQLERIANVTPLGLVPDLTAKESPQDAIVNHPVSPYSEAVRTVRTALRYSDVDAPPKVVMVTSSLPDEGKSVFSLSLARSVAYSGGKALLIECDLRRPSLAKLLKADIGYNTLSLFEPDVDISQVVQIDSLSGMHFIVSRPGTANPQDLLGSKRFRSQIEQLRPHYDLIVLDTPPVLAVSDALILSHAADTTMFLVRWGRTARPVVLGALKAFRMNGGNLAGVVMSRVDFRRHATYGYGDTGYYYGSYGHYENASYGGKAYTEAD